MGADVPNLPVRRLRARFGFQLASVHSSGVIPFSRNSRSSSQNWGNAFCTKGRKAAQSRSHSSTRAGSTSISRALRRPVSLLTLVNLAMAAVYPADACSAKWNRIPLIAPAALPAGGRDAARFDRRPRFGYADSRCGGGVSWPQGTVATAAWTWWPRE